MSVDTEFISEHQLFGPRNIEIEELVLATFVNFPDSYYSIADQLSMNEFSNTENRYIYIAITELAKDSKIDLATVQDRIITKGYDKIVEKYRKGFNILVHLNELCDRVNDDEHLHAHVKILNGYARKRELLKLSDLIEKKCNDNTDPMEIVGTISSRLVEIQELGDVEEFNVVKELKEATDRMQGLTDVKYVKSYLVELDRFMVGWEPGEHIVWAGASSMGKTAAALEVFKNNIIHDIPSAMFSLEMGKTQLINRMLAVEACVPLIEIRRQKTTTEDWNDIHRAISKFDQKKWWIDDKARKLSKIANSIRKYVMKYGVKLIIVDYLQLVVCDYGKHGNREQEVATISRTFKELASELNIVIISLSQINRENNKRSNKRPVMSDLRESGSIEQDADMVVFVYRPAYYDIDNGIPKIEEAEFIIAKGRNTGVGTVKLKFASKFTRFFNSIHENPKLAAYANSERDF